MDASRDDVQRILATVDAIPRGRVATYGEVAREAGLPRRARLVGRVLADLPASSALPWHRVVDARGAIRPRPGPGVAAQRRRLEREGVPVRRDRVDLARFGGGASALAEQRFPVSRTGRRVRERQDVPS